MSHAFDSLAFAKHLTTAGVDRTQAEAHAEAARNFIMGELVTKADLKAAIQAQTITFGVMLASAVGLMGALFAILRP